MSFADLKKKFESLPVTGRMRNNRRNNRNRGNNRNRRNNRNPNNNSRKMGLGYASRNQYFKRGTYVPTDEEYRQSVEFDRETMERRMREQENPSGEVSRRSASGSNRQREISGKMEVARKDMKMFQFNQELFEELKCRWVHSILNGSPEGAYKNDDEMMNETMCVGDGTYCLNANSLINSDESINKLSDVYESILKFTNNNEVEADKIAREIQKIANLICDKGINERFNVNINNTFRRNDNSVLQEKEAFEDVGIFRHGEEEYRQRFNTLAERLKKTKTLTGDLKKQFNLLCERGYGDNRCDDMVGGSRANNRLYGKTYVAPLPGRDSKKHVDYNEHKTLVEQYLKHLQAMELMNASGIVGMRTCGGKKDESDLADNADFFIVLKDLQQACEEKLIDLEESNENLQAFDKDMTNIRSLSKKQKQKLGLNNLESFSDMHEKFRDHKDIQKLRKLEEKYPDDYPNNSSISDRLRRSRFNNRMVGGARRSRRTSKSCHHTARRTKRCAKPRRRSRMGRARRISRRR